MARLAAKLKCRALPEGILGSAMHKVFHNLLHVISPHQPCTTNVITLHQSLSLNPPLWVKPPLRAQLLLVACARRKPTGALPHHAGNIAQHGLSKLV